MREKAKKWLKNEKKRGERRNGKEERNVGGKGRNVGGRGRNRTNYVTSDLTSPSQFQRQLLNYQEQRKNLRKRFQKTRKPRGGRGRRGSQKQS